MSWLVSIRKAAERDLLDARNWYAQQRPGVGDEFLASVTEAVVRLEEDPLRHPVYHRSFRRILTRRFPHKLFYLVEAGTVVVFRVLHGSREHRHHL